MPFTPHPDFVTPPDETVLWRYMTFDRFRQLVESQSLWFARLDQFDDPLEGTLTDGEIWFDPLPEGHPPQFRDATTDPMAQTMRHTGYINCWRLGGESMAMWDLYGKGAGAVAVTTTVGLLKSQLANEPRNVCIAALDYLDWSAPRTLGGMLDLVTRKIRGYEHEAEVRLFYRDVSAIRPDGNYTSNQTALGLPFGIELSESINEVWVGPRDVPSTTPRVETFLAQHGLQVQVRQSSKLSTRRVPQFRG